MVVRIKVIFFLYSFFQEQVSRLWLLWYKQLLIPRSSLQTFNEIFFTVHMISYFTRKTFVFVSIIPLDVIHKLLLSWRVWVSPSADIMSSNKKGFLDNLQKNPPIMWSDWHMWKVIFLFSIDYRFSHKLAINTKRKWTWYFIKDKRFVKKECNNINYLTWNYFIT